MFTVSGPRPDGATLLAAFVGEGLYAAPFELAVGVPLVAVAVLIDRKLRREARQAPP